MVEEKGVLKETNHLLQDYYNYISKLSRLIDDKKLPEGSVLYSSEELSIAPEYVIRMMQEHFLR